MAEDDNWTGLKRGERPFRDAAWFYAEYREAEKTDLEVTVWLAQSGTL